jgi:hypothetical protein
MYFMNMWKNAKDGTCFGFRMFKKMNLNEKQQRKGKIFLLI